MEKQDIRDEVEYSFLYLRNPKSRLLQLLFDVVENKMYRGRQMELDKEVREAVKENRYHLVQNYNNDLIRKSLKSSNNHNRLNVKEVKNNTRMEGVVKKIDEKYRKRIMTLTVGNQI